MAKANQVEDFQDEDEYVEDHAASADGFEIDTGVEMGARTRNSTRAGKYPFDKLDVGQSFHIPATADTPAPGKTLAGAVTNANTKWSHEDPSGELESRVLSTYQLDEEGKRVKVEGRYVKTGEQTVERVKRIQDRHFTIRSVGASDMRGAGARVFRDL